jgi:probable rRNA maturation factor
MMFDYQTIETEARQQGKKIPDHTLHLFVHSCLHLLGYDHMESKEQTIMEQAEIEILKLFNISNPYEIL